MGNYHDQIGADGRPNLGFDGIDALPVKRLDSKMLFDPFEEQFNLPPTFVIVCNLFGVAVSDIGKKDNILIFFGIDKMDATKIVRIMLFGLVTGKPNHLITLQPCGSVDWGRGFSIKLQILFGSHDKSTTNLMHLIQSLEVYVRTIHDVNATGIDRNQIQDVHIMSSTIGYVNERWDRAFYVHKCMEFNSSLVLAKFSPRKQRQTQIDGGRIQGVDRLGNCVQIPVFYVKTKGLVDENHGQFMIDLPGTVGIGSRQGITSHIGSDAHMVTSLTEGIQRGGQISQTFTEGELSEAQTEKLSPACKFLYTIISFVLGNNLSKFVFRNNIHKL